MKGKLLINFALIICFFCCSSGRVIESPHYKVIHVESDFEIRQYKQVSWMAALVQGTASFEKSTQQGFHRLYQYIHGGNSNSSHFLITSPVTTTIMASKRQPEHLIRYYLPIGNAENPPLPDSELNVQFEKWRSNCLAVRRFPEGAAISEYTIAQYNSSRRLLGRLNEVWLDVSGFTAEGCQPL